MKIEETTQEVASEDDSETKDTDGKEDQQEKAEEKPQSTSETDEKNS